MRKRIARRCFRPQLDAFDVHNFDCDDLTTPRNEYKSHAHAGNAYLFEDF